MHRYNISSRLFCEQWFNIKTIFLLDNVDINFILIDLDRNITPLRFFKKNINFLINWEVSNLYLEMIHLKKYKVQINYLNLFGKLFYYEL